MQKLFCTYKIVAFLLVPLISVLTTALKCDQSHTQYI